MLTPREIEQFEKSNLNPREKRFLDEIKDAYKNIKKLKEENEKLKNKL